MRLCKILIVDDFKPFRGFVRSVLETRADCLITEASDGLEAVQKTEEFRPDLILLDIGLPNLNGIDVARQVRRLAPATKILFVTAVTAPDVVQKALSFGALGYVHKSRAHSDLLPAIEAVLKGQPFISTDLNSGNTMDI